MEDNLGLERPNRLPKVRRSTRTSDKFGANGRVNQRRTTKNVYREVVTPHLDKSACERLIYEQVESAIAGNYETRAEFLNQLHSLVVETLPESLSSPDFFELLCQRILLFLKDEYPAIRAMCFRIMRLSLFTERNMTYMLTNHVDIYVVRGLDLCVDNEVERCEALRLIGSMISLYETSNLKKLIEEANAKKEGKKYAFPKSIMQPVIAIALKAMNKSRSGDSTTQAEGADNEGDDRLGLSCISMFLEFCIDEPYLIIDMAGTDWMVRVLTGTANVSRRICSLVGRVLVSWLDDATVRNYAQLHLVLEQIFAPLIEFGFFQETITGTEKVDKVVEGVLDTFSHSFLGILRSWSGLFSCAAVGPKSTVLSSSPLRLLEYLGLGTVGNANLSYMRDMIVNICCDFIDAPYASKTFNNWKEAVEFYGSLSSPDVFSSSLKEEFVLSETDILQNNDSEFALHVDILSSFRTLAFFVLINASLPQSFARLIVANPDAPSAIKATLLLSDFLRIAPSVVPSGWRASVLSMPSLVQSACESLAGNRAAAATHGYTVDDANEQFTFVNAENAALTLYRFDTLNRVWINNMSVAPPLDSNYSLFMDHRSFGNNPADFKSVGGDQMLRSRLQEIKDGDRLNPTLCSLLFNQVLRDTEVCEEKRLNCLDDVVDVIVKVLEVVSPAKGPQLSWNENKAFVVAGKMAIQLGLELCSRSDEAEDALNTFMVETKAALETGELFSMKNLIYKATMYYFALIGAFSGYQRGIYLLEKHGIFHIFMERMNRSTPTEYVKLVVSCMDYGGCGGESLTRVVLEKALTSTSEPSRRWCTRFVGALAALRLPNFHEWGFLLLLRQLGDESVKVVRQTIRMLQTWMPVYPDSVICLRAVQLDAFGEAGMLLKAHLFLEEQMCSSNEDMAREAIRAWMTGFNTRFVESVDEDMRIALLNIRRSMQGGFSRVSSVRLDRFGVRPPAHLLGSLAKHEYGRWLLKEERVCRQLLSQLNEDKDISVVKGAVVALGHIGETDEGMALLPTEVVPRIIRLAEQSGTLSVRGTAFWALNIIATSAAGAASLCEYGWESNQHRWVVDKARRFHEKEYLEEEEQRRGTNSVVPEVSISFDRALPPRRVDSPTGRNYRARSSSDSSWMPLKTVAETPKLRKSGSDLGLHYEESSTPVSEYDSSENPRSRAMTTESAWNSGFSSYVDDSSGSRRRATTTTGSVCGEDVESRSRSSTVARCLSQGLIVDKSRLEAEGTVADLLRDPHFSTKNRERWRLAPFKMRRYLQVNRNIGDPVRFIFMTKNEEECVSLYRRYLLHDPWLQRHLRTDGEQPGPHAMHAVHIAALPSEVQVMCSNIFTPRRVVSAEDHTVNDRGAKSGHSKNQRTDAGGFAHSSYRCFYCEANTEKYPLPSDVDVAQLRRQVLHEVDMLEVKESIPEKKLISLRSVHPWLFEWPCLYADVLELLDEYRFKPRSRSFLQEIFYGALKL